MAIEEALEMAQKTTHLPVPLHLRNAPTKLMKNIDYGKNYKYAHQFEGSFVDLEFMPESLIGKTFFNPGSDKKEQEMKLQLMKWWKGKYNYE